MTGHNEHFSRLNGSFELREETTSAWAKTKIKDRNKRLGEKSRICSDDARKLSSKCLDRQSSVLLRWNLLRLQDELHGPSASSQRESVEKSEGLKQGCLAKGSKAGTGGKVAKMMVAISHGKGVLTCERYEKMDAQYFTSFIDQHFDIMLERSGEGLNRLWLQDGDPSQNSKSACDAMFCRLSSQTFKVGTHDGTSRTY